MMVEQMVVEKAALSVSLKAAYLVLYWVELKVALSAGAKVLKMVEWKVAP